MSIGSGLAAQLGVAAETVYGTYVAPSRFFEFSKESLKMNKRTVQGGGLAAGRFAQLGSRRVVVGRDASGSVDFDVTTKGMGLLFAHLMGSSATPVQQGGTAAYLQTHAFGDNVGKSLSVQAGVPETSGTVRPMSFVGGKITGASFECGVDAMLTSTWDFDFRDLDDTKTLAAASYPASGAILGFMSMSVKIGTVGAEQTVSGIKKWSAKIERPQATSRYYAGASARKAEPIMNDWLKVTGSLEADFVDKTILSDRFMTDGSFSLVVEFTGALIASTYYETVRFRFPACFLDGETPTVDGPGLTSGTFPFVVQSDGTNSVATIEYISTDTTL